MDPKRHTAELPPDVAAYVAGLIDGEGTITLTRLHSGENRRLVVSIANTELPLLTFVLDKVGVGKITRKKTTSYRHAPSYCYAVSSRHALSLLQQVQPYLRSYKRLRADLALKRYLALTPRNGKYTEAVRAERVEFEQRLLCLGPRRHDQA